MALTVRAIPCLSDNYAWAVTDAATGTVAICDPGEARPVLADLPEGRCDFILLTHHHQDHIGGVAELVAATGAKVVGARADAYRLPPLDHALSPGDGIAIGSARAVVIDTPGHTRGHIAFHLQSPRPQGPGQKAGQKPGQKPGQDILLCGDTLFSLGCGRLLEGTAEEMFTSLQRLRILPPETLVCCGHEYTLSNARFALTVEPDNKALQARAQQAREQRGRGEPTVPTRLEEEMAANPFLRAPDVATLAKLRKAKDEFR
ncbi:hydroxyacylglutathione hydrolase [Roseomonas gilardii subsp. gilardii]|uniref:hydroxyacylglutathione hydrolase n=1 Tax=Roseomonas gilardii TaxID=257708 RepID=UPI001FFB1631|nr:hydroxyacylglutathione hydrolase [Roseomonas gilardii]UPG73251.1 hydroxyacylglutathione hydrolase [Roseomonas gilardii subsp. gilardii]